MFVFRLWYNRSISQNGFNRFLKSRLKKRVYRIVKLFRREFKTLPKKKKIQTHCRTWQFYRKNLIAKKLVRLCIEKFMRKLSNAVPNTPCSFYTHLLCNRTGCHLQSVLGIGARSECLDEKKKIIETRRDRISIPIIELFASGNDNGFPDKTPAFVVRVHPTGCAYGKRYFRASENEPRL